MNPGKEEVVKKKKEEIQENLQVLEDELQSKYFAGQFLTKLKLKQCLFIV